MTLSIFMNKLNLPYIISYVYNNRVYWQGVIAKVNIKFFLNPLQSNITNIAKDTFIVSTEDINKKTPGHEKVMNYRRFKIQVIMSVYSLSFHFYAGIIYVTG